jgi:predicted ferric reductase
MELRGWAHRLAEVASVLAAGVAVYIAYDKVWIEHGEYLSAVIAAVFVAFAFWIILGWLGIVRGPRLVVGRYKLPEKTTDDNEPPAHSN